MNFVATVGGLRVNLDNVVDISLMDSEEFGYRKPDREEHETHIVVATVANKVNEWIILWAGSEKECQTFLANFDIEFDTHTINAGD